MVSLREKICYGLGDFGCNIVFATVSAWFVPFCVSIGISVQQAGLILFLSKFIDAICDLCLGIAIDNDQNRIKKLMKIGIAPTVAFLLLMFAVPYFPEYSRLLLMFCLFNLTNSVFYNFFNIPYSSLNLAISEDAQDRYALNCFRMAGSISCMILINIVYPLVLNKLVLYSVCSAIMILCFLATIYGTKVRATIEKNPINLAYFKNILSDASFWLSLVTFFAINFKLNVTMCQIGMNADKINPGLATICFMCPSIVTLFILPSIMMWNRKYITLAVALIIDAIIQAFVPKSLIMYLIDGFVFSILAAMIYNLFAGVSGHILTKSGIKVSGLLFAIAGIVSNLCAGFMGLCLTLQISLDLVLLVVTILGALCTIGLCKAYHCQWKNVI